MGTGSMTEDHYYLGPCDITQLMPLHDKYSHVTMQAMTHYQQEEEAQSSIIIIT